MGEAKRRRQAKERAGHAAVIESDRPTAKGFEAALSPTRPPDVPEGAWRVMRAFLETMLREDMRDVSGTDLADPFALVKAVAELRTLTRGTDMEADAAQALANVRRRFLATRFEVTS